MRASIAALSLGLSAACAEDGRAPAAARVDATATEPAPLEQRVAALLDHLEAAAADVDAALAMQLPAQPRTHLETARSIHPDLPPMQAAEKLAAERLDFDQALETAKQQLGELAALIVANDVVGLFDDQKATVRVSPPFMRWNAAFLDMSGLFERAPAAFYFISPPDPSWSKETQAAYLPFEADLFATSVHEVYPGHFVQGLHQNRAPSRAQKIFSSYAFVEGWAHYTEEMIFEADPAMGGAWGSSRTRSCAIAASSPRSACTPAG